MTQWNERVYKGLPPHEEAQLNGSTTPLGKSASEVLPFVDDYYANVLVPGDVFTFAAIANSGTNGEVNIAIKLLERL